MDWTRTISPSLVNEARAGVNYVFLNNGSASNGLTNFAQTVGIPGVPSSFLPSMSLSGGNVSSFGTSDVYQLFADTVIHYEDTLILTKGTNTMHFGFQGYRYRMDTFYSGNNGRAGTISLQRPIHCRPSARNRGGNEKRIGSCDRHRRGRLPAWSSR